MQTIKFKTLKLTNVRCHIEEQELTFHENQLVAIAGKNGRGKSSFFMAFVAALYGRTAEGFTIADLVNRKVGKNLEIILTFDIDSDEYRIERYYKHSKGGNKLMLFKNDEDISRKTATETYAYISNLLIPERVFLNSVYFSQQVKDFFTSLTDKSQKEIFNAILQLDEWKDYYASTNEEIKSQEVGIQDSRDSQIVLESKIPEKEIHIQYLVDTRESDIKTRDTELKSLHVILEQHEKDLVVAESYVSQTKYDSVEHERIKTEIVELHIKIQNLQGQIHEYTEKAKDDDINKRQEIKDKQAMKLAEFKNKLTEDFLVFKESKASETTEYKSRIEKITIESTSEIRSKEQLLTKISNRKIAVTEKYNLGDIKENKSLSIAKIEKTKSEVSSKIISITHQITQCKLDIESLNIKINDFVEASKSDKVVCSECGQECSTEHQKELAKKHTSREKEYEDLGIRLDKLERNKIALESDIEVYDNEIQIESDKYDKQLVASSDMQKVELDKIDKDSTKISSEIAAIEVVTEKKIAEVQVELDAVDNIIQVRSVELKATFEKNKESLVHEANELFDKLTIITAERIAKKESELKNSGQEFEEKVNSLIEENKTFETQLEELNELKRKVIEIKSNITQVSEQIVDLDTKEFTTEHIDTANQDLVETKKQIEDIIVSKKTQEEDLGIFDFWKTGFSDRGIPSMLIDDAIPFMNKTVKEELSKVAPGKFIVSFDTTSETKSGDVREKFAVNVLNTENGADSHKFLSGGEKRQIDVCCMRALRLLAENLYQKKFNITLYDEVLDSLDDENAGILCQNLRMLCKGQNVTIITHSTLQGSECDQVLRM